MENNAIDTIVKDNVPRLQRYVRGRVPTNEDAEDIVQETLYQFLRTIQVLDNPISHVSSWLYTVAHNLIVNHGKKHHEETADSFLSDFSEILMTSGDDNPDIQVLRSMVWEELDKALQELPAEQREAVVMTEINGLSVKEASARMGVSQNTFLSRKHYAVKHIRFRLKNLYDEIRNA